ncbi:hypothetical protein HD806DRAFT_546627 [Xylariaceae sp. AK1471]|nr:hypothetical protein HD806DRAFT_546627 [Xylariaceae sp. AK1471]
MQKIIFLWARAALDILSAGFSTTRTVYLDEGYIVGASACSLAKTVINGKGKFLIPGLIDNRIQLTDITLLEDYTSYGCTSAMNMACLNPNYTKCDILTNQPGLASSMRAGMPAIGNGIQQRQRLQQGGRRGPWAYLTAVDRDGADHPRQVQQTVNDTRPLIMAYEQAPGSNQTLEHAKTNARNLYSAGVPFLTSTDTISSLIVDCGRDNCFCALGFDATL